MVDRIHCILIELDTHILCGQRVRNVFDFWIYCMTSFECLSKRITVVNAVKNCSEWNWRRDQTVTCTSQNSDGQYCPAGLHLHCTLHPTHLLHADEHKWPSHPATCPPTVQLRGLDKGESGSFAPIETRGNSLAWHVPHLSPVHILKDQYNQIISPVQATDPWVWKRIRSPNYNGTLWIKSARSWWAGRHL